MKLLILFLFLIQFGFCSGVYLLEYPKKLPEKQLYANMGIPVVDGLNDFVVGMMNLFTSDLLTHDAPMSDQEIITYLKTKRKSILEQYTAFHFALKNLSKIPNFIDEKINFIQQQINLNLTLGNQQNSPAVQRQQLLIDNNICIQNTIILAINLIEGIINENTQNERQKYLDKFKTTVEEYLNSFENQLDQYVSDYIQFLQNYNHVIINHIQLLRNHNQDVSEYIKSIKDQERQNMSYYIENLRNQLNQLSLPEINHPNLVEEGNRGESSRGRRHGRRRV